MELAAKSNTNFTCRHLELVQTSPSVEPEKKMMAEDIRLVLGEVSLRIFNTKLSEIFLVFKLLLLGQYLS